MFLVKINIMLNTFVLFFAWILIHHTAVATVDMTCETKPSVSEEAETVISELLNIAGGLIENARKYEKVKSSMAALDLSERSVDCDEILLKNRSASSGIYKIWPRSRILERSVTVYCDMEDDGGAWTVIQRRGDFDSGKEYFYQDWAAYKTGFGNLQKDFWLGNDNIFALTNQRANSVKFVLTDWEGNKTYATFDEFWIDNEDYNYTLHVKGYRGTAGDSFSGGNEYPFTTKDRDNDKSDKNCAVQYKGAWWYTKCHASNLNGLYLRGTHESHADGVNWHSFKGLRYSLKDTVIKLRSKTFDNVIKTERKQKDSHQ